MRNSTPPANSVGQVNQAPHPSNLVLSSGNWHLRKPQGIRGACSVFLYLAHSDASQDAVSAI